MARRRPRPKLKLDPAILAAIEEAAERAAKRNANRVVKHILVALGINATTPEDQIETQKDAAFLRKLRINLDTRAGKIGYAVLAALLSLSAGLIVFAVNRIFGKT